MPLISKDMSRAVYFVSSCVKKVECGVDVGSIGGRVFVDGKIYRINEEVEVEEGNKKH